MRCSARSEARRPRSVPIFDPITRDVWMRGGPQPIADAVAHLASSSTTVEADAALRELVAITCRWLAVIALAELSGDTASAEMRERARDVTGRDDAAPWLALARAAPTTLPGLVAALARCDALAALADRLDDGLRATTGEGRGRTLAALAVDVAAMVQAMRDLEPLLAYQLVVGARRRGGVVAGHAAARSRAHRRVGRASRTARWRCSTAPGPSSRSCRRSCR